MWTAKWILDLYEEGDEAVRWDLYMLYPELRGYFDRAEARLQQSGEENTGRAREKKSRPGWNPCARLVKGFGG